MLISMQPQLMRRCIFGIKRLRSSHRGDYQTAAISILRLYAPYRQMLKQMTREYFLEKRPELTEREMEIAHLVSLGLTNSEIGARLFITQNTVKTMDKVRGSF